MTPEELLKPRYRVIADYPNSGYDIGDILTPDREYWSKENSIRLCAEDVSQYPHLFQKLEWWQERKPEEMPEYVKLMMGEAVGYVHKVEKWKGVNCNGQPLYLYYNRVNFLSTACVSETLPATADEYNHYQQSKQTQNG